MPSIIKFFEGIEDPTAAVNMATLQRQQTAADVAAKRKAMWDPIRAEAQKNIEKIKKYGSLGAAKSRENPNGLNDMVANNTPAPKSNAGLLGASTAHAADAPPTTTSNEPVRYKIPKDNISKPSSAEAQFRLQNSSAPAPAPKHSPAPAAPKQTDSTMTASEQARRGNYSAPSSNSTMTASEQARRGNYSAPEQAATPPSTPKQAPAAPAQAEYKDSWQTKKTPEQVAATTPITQQMKAVSAPKPARQSNEQLMAKAKQDATNAAVADKKSNPQDYDQNGNLIAPSSVPQAAVGARDASLRSVPKPPDVGQEEQFRVGNSKPSIIDKLKSSDDNENTMNNVLSKGKSMLGSFSNLATDR